MTDTPGSLHSLRFRHLASGLLVAVGGITIVLSVVTAADGLHGFTDVFEFLGTLALSVGCGVLGWEWSE